MQVTNIHATVTTRGAYYGLLKKKHHMVKKASLQFKLLPTRRYFTHRDPMLVGRDEVIYIEHSVASSLPLNQIRLSFSGKTSDSKGSDIVTPS